MPDRTRTTLSLERKRSVALGIVESATGTFLLLIVVRWFHGGPIAKALCAGVVQIGLLFTPFVVALVRRRGLSPTRTAGISLCVAGCGYLVAACAPNGSIFLFAVSLSVILPAACTPLFASIYQANYPARIRGQLYAQSNSIRIISSIFFATIAGYAMSGHLEYYPLLMVIFALSLLYNASCVVHMPFSEEDLSTLQSVPGSLFDGFRFLASDRVFRQTIISWMLLGLGTLMMFPLRVEYLANPRYGLHLDEATITIYVLVIPALARLVGSRIWGKLFDTIDFFRMRMILNASFVLAILSFFTSDKPLGLISAALLFGLSTAGGDIAWNLWATKLAPSNRVADYMAVHTFMTGVRGLIAPLIAFLLLEKYSITTVCFLSSALIILSILVLLFSGRFPTTDFMPNPKKSNG